MKVSKKFYNPVYRCIFYYRWNFNQCLLRFLLCYWNCFYPRDQKNKMNSISVHSKLAPNLLPVLSNYSQGEIQRLSSTRLSFAGNLKKYELPIKGQFARNCFFMLNLVVLSLLSLILVIHYKFQPSCLIALNINCFCFAMKLGFFGYQLWFKYIWFFLIHCIVFENSQLIKVWH